MSAQAQDDDAELVTFLRHQAFAASRTSHARAQEIGQRLGVAADRIEALARLSVTTPDTTVLGALISKESIERLAEDIAIACVDCRTEIVEARHRAMVRLGERLRNPLPNDIKALAALTSTANPTGETR